MEGEVENTNLKILSMRPNVLNCELTKKDYLIRPSAKVNGPKKMVYLRKFKFAKCKILQILNSQNILVVKVSDVQVVQYYFKM